MLRCVLCTSFFVGFSLSGASAQSENLVSTDKLALTTATGQPEGRVVSLVHPNPPYVFEPNKQESNRHLTVLMVGDTGYAPSRAAPLPNGVYKYGRWQTFKQTTQRIHREINGDINFANIETVISASSKLRPVAKKYNFVTHPNGARHLVDIGFNLFSLANNHAFDYGQNGIRDSLLYADELKKNGLFAHAGIGLNRQQAADIALFETNGMRVAFGAIGIGAGGGGIQRATHQRPGQLSLNNPADVKLLSSNLRNSDADLRLLSIHRGPERHIRPYAHEIQSVRNIVKKSRADVMIGHHAHVARGMEIMNGSLIVYGLGNFLHQGTANMNGKGGCQDYSLIVKAHFTSQRGNKPSLAAIEALPIYSTHMQTQRLPAKLAAKRIAVLNGLARQFDNFSSGSQGVRFMTQSDGSGLFCTNAAQYHTATRNLCANFSPKHLASDKHYSRALASCGRIAPNLMIARASEIESPGHVSQKPIKKPVKTVSVTQEKIQDSETGLQLKTIVSASITQPRRLGRNPQYWPAGMPLAWDVPANETGKQKHRRWVAKRYSVAEVEHLLRKRGLIK